VLAFHGGARDSGAGADGTLTGLLRDDHAVRTRRRGANDGGPAMGATSRAVSRDAAHTAPAPFPGCPRRAAAAVPRRLQSPAAAAGDADDRERHREGGRPE
jgi:hypothetical protein